MIPPTDGDVPASPSERSIMFVWPSLAARSDGQALGRIYCNDAGFELCGIPIKMGGIIALLTAPLVIPLFFLTLLPWSAIRYRLTNRRVIVERGWRGAEVSSVALERFDNIEIDVRPGQAWYRAGDLVFRLGATETFRLAGVSHPESFRHTCLKAHQSYVGVQKSQPPVGV